MHGQVRIADTAGGWYILQPSDWPHLMPYSSVMDVEMQLEHRADGTTWIRQRAVPNERGIELSNRNGGGKR